MGHISLDGLDKQVELQQRTLDRLMDIAEAQITINNNLQTAIKLLQQSHDEFVNVHEKEMGDLTPKVRTLWDNRSQFKGGYVVISVLGGIIVGGSGVALVLVELLKK